MARADIINIMYSKEKSPLEFHFDALTMPSMYNFITVQDIEQLRHIATSSRYSAKIDLKYKAIDEIMRRRGFRKFHCGTNRIIYKFLESDFFLVKIALDKVGMTDNPKEFKNQNFLKPFVTKMFECSPCGTVAFVERVQPITSRQEFISVGDDIFHLITNCIIGKYVVDDIGTKYFMNYGLRNGYGPVLLDYPYVYELDGNKMYCNKIDPLTGTQCGGVIDYDDGFNDLYCTKCGKHYLAQELEGSIKNNLILLKDEGDVDMKITIQRGKKIISTFDTSKETDVIINRVPKSMKMSSPKKDVTLIKNGRQLDIYDDELHNSYHNRRDRHNNNNRRNDNNHHKNNNHKNDNKNYRKDNNPKKEYKGNSNNQNRKNQPRPSQVDKFSKVDNTIKPTIQSSEASVETTLKIDNNITPNVAFDTKTKHLTEEEVNKVKTELHQDDKVEKEPASGIDMMTALGVSDKDFEEPVFNEEPNNDEQVIKESNKPDFNIDNISLDKF